PESDDYKMLRTTPPSARTAAPLIVTDCVPARNATTAATSSGVSNRLSNELGRTLWKTSFSSSALEMPFCLARDSTNWPTPSDAVGPTRTEFTETRESAIDAATPRAVAIRGVL